MIPLKAHFEQTRAHTEHLCAPLRKEDYIPQPVEFASPPKWHLAHTSWFFEELVLKKFLSDYTEFHPHFGFLFNSYYNSVGPKAVRTHRGNITRPDVDEVYAYRAHVDFWMGKLLSENFSKEVEELVVLGINHEQQHQELLLTDLKYVLALNPIYPMYEKHANLLSDKNTSEEWISMNEGIYEIGHNSDAFCYDNELGRHNVFLHTYEISSGLVTNGDYLQFIEAGGYQKFNFWLDEGWAWVNANEISAPLYWKKIDGVWFQFTLGGLVKIDPDAILGHVSFYEADAFARWKACRLPTEFEWEAASNRFEWGKRWEWTNSAYLPYPGFTVAAGAVGEYNGKFMINQMVLRGASVATAPGHSRNTYRNFFHPHHQWQFSGIRLAR